MVVTLLLLSTSIEVAGVTRFDAAGRAIMTSRAMYTRYVNDCTCLEPFSPFHVFEP